MYTKVKQRWLEMQASNNESSDEDNDDKMFANKKQIIPLWKRLNKDGFTPLTLAAQVAQTEMFSFLLEERKRLQWRYGPVSCVLYPLDQVDLEFPTEGEDVTEILIRK
jgi:hypothetical protein